MRTLVFPAYIYNLLFLRCQTAQFPLTPDLMRLLHLLISCIKSLVPPSVEFSQHWSTSVLPCDGSEISEVYIFMTSAWLAASQAQCHDMRKI